jgi:hypothetical protein
MKSTVGRPRTGRQQRPASMAERLAAQAAVGVRLWLISTMQQVDDDTAVLVGLTLTADPIDLLAGVEEADGWLRQVGYRVQVTPLPFAALTETQLAVVTTLPRDQFLVVPVGVMEVGPPPPGLDVSAMAVADFEVLRPLLERVGFRRAGAGG